jgi:hypothetical protein
MRGDTDPMAICLLERLTKCNKGLDVASRADNLDDDVKTRWRRLAG